MEDDATRTDNSHGTAPDATAAQRRAWVARPLGMIVVGALVLAIAIAVLGLIFDVVR